MPDEHDDAVRTLAAAWLRSANADLEVASLTDDERMAPEAAAVAAQVVAWRVAQLHASGHEERLGLPAQTP